MKNNFFIKIVLVLFSFLFCTVGVFANQDTPDSAASNLTNPPITQIKKTSDGSTSRMTTIPGHNNYAAGTMTKADGSVNQVVTYKDSNGSTMTSITKPDGSTINATRAADGTYSGDAEAIDAASSMDKGTEQTISITSEKVPGAECKCIAKSGDCINGPVEERKYECTTGKGLAGFQNVFAQIIRFVINMMLLLGVFAVVGLGIAWTFAGADDIKAKTNLKSLAINIIIGLVILFLFRQILLFLAPWIYQ